MFQSNKIATSVSKSFQVAYSNAYLSLAMIGGIR